MALSIDDPGLALAPFVERAWALHADAPRAVAEHLIARAGALPADDDGAAALRLAEHVLLGHLADVDGYERFITALPPGLAAAEATAPMVARMAWSLAVLCGRPATPPPDGARWRALHGLWSVSLARGQADVARIELLAEEPQALVHPDAAARQGLAATCNNLAADLRDGSRGDAARDRLMLAAAQASRRLWASAGTWVQIERADWLLARCHAVLGDGAVALVHARACHDAIEAHAGEPQADAFERFFAHEALAWAHRASADRGAARVALAAAQALLPQIGDASLRAYGEVEAAKLAAALE
jgi:hypothetical protein